MKYTKVGPRITDTGIVFPKRQEYLDALTKVVTAGLGLQYFGIYFTGMTMTATGNWAVPDDQDPDGLAQISLDDIFSITQELGFSGQVWLCFDCPYGGLWVLEISK